MADEQRIRQLLEEVMESGRTPEGACANDPDLLPEVRDRWRRIQDVQAQLDTMFPTPDPASGGSGGGRRLRAAEALRTGGGGGGPPDIPGYAVDSILGRGGMGIVYKATHLKLHRPVAIKMLLLGPYASARELTGFMREAEAVAALRHPNIVQVYDVGELDGLPYFTMEYVEGGTLARKLGGAPQPAREAAGLVATLAAAVQVAHEGGIVHRDLKPANILLTADGTPRIADFSLARRFEGDATLTLSGAQVGTPSYMAPEQAAGKPEAFGPSVDIYALGALLYEALTGRPPFKADTPSETQRQVITEEPAPPSRLNARVPRDLETICLKCLQKEPTRRYGTAGALADDLRRLLGGQPITARPVGRAERAVRWMRRNPTAAALIATASLFLLLAVGFGLREWRLLVMQRAEMAKWKDRLAFVIGLQEEGRFTEARAILQRVPDGGSGDLRAQIEKAKADLGVVERLDAIRMSRGTFVQGGGIDYAESSRAYEAAFREARLGELGEDPERVAARLKVSPVRRALVAALDDWAACATAEPRGWVLAVARGMDPDPWRDRVRDQDRWADVGALAELADLAVVEEQPVTIMVAMGTRWRRLGGDPTAFLERVQRRYPNDFWVNFELGHLLGGHDLKSAIGYARAALAVRPNAEAVHYNIGTYLSQAGRREQAIHHYRRAIEIDPRHTLAQINLAACLDSEGQLGESVEHYREASALDPSSIELRRAVRASLCQQGRHVEARAEWRRWLDTGPADAEEWDGYAELSLFLGDEAGYHRACDELLARFGDSADARVCERIGRACLLLPPDPEHLRIAEAMIDRALAADPSQYEKWAYPYFLFARALAEYRQDRLDSAIALLEGEASGVLEPAPGLVLAMAQHRLGQEEEARRTIESAVSAYDWRVASADTREAWMYHALRREAESMILAGGPGSALDRPSEAK